MELKIIFCRILLHIRHIETYLRSMNFNDSMNHFFTRLEVLEISYILF